jgi:RNA-dependent RNA polymerase
LGQSLSCSIETIRTNKFKEINDIKRGNYCFTDGIGQISKAKAEEICERYFNSQYISCFQIRFGGFKGVVTINPEISDELIFRPSMNKFPSSNNRLDILNKAEFIPCHLNRQVIIILTALGIDDSVFSYFQDEMLQNLSKFLVDNNVAKNYLAKFFKNHYAFGMACMQNNYSFEYTNEPFFRELLKLVYKNQLTDLIHKSRIFIEKGRILMVKFYHFYF